MKCSKCGRDVKPSDTFCMGCGQRVEVFGSSPAQNSAPVQSAPAPAQRAPLAQPVYQPAPVQAPAVQPMYQPMPMSSGRTQYKTVAGPVGLIIGPRDSYSVAVREYAKIIDREAVGGWKLDCIQTIPVSQKPGCIAGLLGASATTVTFNMLVFRKDG